ncbi:hypothetical protein LG329_16210 [Virgibacillus necropolis]|uniref:hypothetical protein n=1 Tax=Virgibacillus necropolis TaxID=163877 RepID=UPI00384C4F8F
MREYIQYRYKSYLSLALGIGIGTLAAFLFSDMNDDYVFFKWMVLGCLIAEILHLVSWFRNKKKDSN